MTVPSVHLLDTTLRDGSYEVDFQFTVEDTALIVTALEQAGLSYIELCHGHGFAFDRWRNWPGARKQRAAATDEAHLEIAAAVASHAKVGCVIVTENGFVTNDDISLVHKLGAKFIRLVTPPEEATAPHLLDFVAHGKSLGLIVAVNIMQTYAIPLLEIAETARTLEKAGADWLYVVDSAGGMSGAEVGAYVRTIRDASGLTVGLHSHNNSGVGLSNCLSAIEAGATLVDATIQGMGRNTGNPSTEQLLLALQRGGQELNVDGETIWRLGELLRAIVLHNGGNDPTDFVFGGAKLPWRQVPQLVALARKTGLPERPFLMSAAKEAHAGGVLSRMSYPKEVLERATLGTKKRLSPTINPALKKATALGIGRASSNDLSVVTDELIARAGKRRRRSVLHLAPRSVYPFSGPQAWETADFVGTTLGVEDSPHYDSIAKDRLPSVLMIDPRLAAPPTDFGPTIHRVSYDTLELEAAADIATSANGHDPISVVEGDLGNRLRSVFEMRGVRLASQRDGRPALFVASSSSSAAALRAANNGDIVVLVGEKGPSTFVEEARATNSQILRPTVGPLVGSLANRLEAARKGLGEARRRPFGAFGVVEAPTVPRHDEVLVDNIDAPTRVIDGESTPELLDELAHVRATSLLDGRGTL